MPVLKLSRSTDALTVACLRCPKSLQANGGNAVRLGENLFFKRPLPFFVVSVTIWTRLTPRPQLFIRCYSSCETCASIPFWITLYSLCEPPCIPFFNNSVFSFGITLYSIFGSPYIPFCIILYSFFLDHPMFYFHCVPFVVVYMIYSLNSLYVFVLKHLNTLRTRSFKLFKRPFPGFLTILTL